VLSVTYFNPKRKTLIYANPYDFWPASNHFFFFISLFTCQRETYGNREPPLGGVFAWGSRIHF
jgi:hypothetical protein